MRIKQNAKENNLNLKEAKACIEIQKQVRIINSKWELQKMRAEVERELQTICLVDIRFFAKTSFKLRYGSQ